MRTQNEHQPVQYGQATETLSRRALLRRVALLGAGTGASWLLAACGRSSASSSAEGGTGEGESVACAEDGQVSGADAATRRALSYVDESPRPDQRCANCRFFKQPAGDASCGRCEIVSGPIAPGGYCTAWAAAG